MGIRFHCPNGHKLNVKAFLAGKKGFCPHCGVKVDIPTESEGKGPTTTGGTELELDPNPAGQRGAPAAPIGTVPTTPAAVPTSPAGQALQPKAVPMTPAAVPTSAPVGMARATPAAAPAAAVPAAAAPTAVPDAISEAPTAKWYVRPPSGGQFGPAVGDIMRKWIGEGRVSADSMVWREGWADWRSAVAVFPSLGGGNPAPSAAVSPAPPHRENPDPLAGNPMPTPVASPYRTRRKSNTMALAMVVVLTLASIGLLVALGVVISVWQ